MRSALAAASLAVLVVPELAGAQSMRTVALSRLRQDDEEVRVSIEYGAGRLSVRPLDGGLLYRMNLRYDEEHFEPVAEYASHRLHLGVESIRGAGWTGRRESGELELELARDLPMKLDLQFGAVQADLDLGGLALTDLDLRTGASESVVDISELNRTRMARARFQVGAADFTVRHLGNLNADLIDVDAGVGSLTLGLDGAWQQDARISIGMGLGVLELRVPEGLGLRLKKDSLLTALDSEGLVKRGDTYQSIDWDEADHKVTIDLDAAFGSVKVVWAR